MYGGLPLRLEIYYAVFGTTYTALRNAESIMDTPGLRRFAIIIDARPDCIVPFADVCNIPIRPPDILAFALLSIRQLDIHVDGEQLNIVQTRCAVLTLRARGWCSVLVPNTLRVVCCVNMGEFEDCGSYTGDIVVSPKVVEFVNTPTIEHVKCVGYSVDTTNMANPGLLSVFQSGPRWQSSLGDHRELRAIYMCEPFTYHQFYKLQYAMVIDDIVFTNMISNREKDRDRELWLDRYGCLSMTVPGSRVTISAIGDLYEYGCRFLERPPAKGIQILETSVHDTRVLGEYLYLCGMYLHVTHRCMLDVCAPNLRHISIQCGPTARRRKFSIHFPTLTDMILENCIVDVQIMPTLEYVSYTDCVVSGTPWVKNTISIRLRNTRITHNATPGTPAKTRISIDGKPLHKIARSAYMAMVLALKRLHVSNVD